MIALDTNILVYSHRPESPFHERAKEVVKRLAEGPDLWAIPWTCVHEFLAITTNSRIFKSPTPIMEATAPAGLRMTSPTLELIGEGNGYFSVLQSLLERGAVSGTRVHDARIAAICLSNGVRRLYTADRDFSRFSAFLDVSNPL